MFADSPPPAHPLSRSLSLPHTMATIASPLPSSTVLIQIKHIVGPIKPLHSGPACPVHSLQPDLLTRQQPALQ